MLRIVILAALIPAASPAETPTIEPAQRYCTDGNGRPVELGGVICIQAGCQTWLARCDTSLNNVIWRKIQDGCPGVGPSVPKLPVSKVPS